MLPPTTTLKLESVCARITVGHVGPMASEYVDEGIPFLRSQNIKPFRLDLDDVKFITAAFHERLRKSALRPGDVAVIRTGYPGVAAVVPRSLPDANCADLVVITPTLSQLDPYYLAAIFNSTWGKATVAGNLVGVAQQHFNIGAARNLDVVLPSMAVQRRAVDIFLAYDDLIENCDRRIRVLDEMARAVYREWFVNFLYPGHEKVPLVDSPLGRIPRGWSAGSIAKATRFLGRGITPTYDEDGSSVVINQKCIRESRLDLSPARRQSKAIPDERLVRAGDVLINSTGVGTLGRVAQVLKEMGNCTVDTHVTIARPADRIDPAFFGLALLGLEETFERKGVGATGQTELNRTSIGETALVIPGFDCQLAFGDHVRPMREATLNLQERSAILRRTRDLLLPRLLSGQLSVDVESAA